MVAVLVVVVVVFGTESVTPHCACVCGWEWTERGGREIGGANGRDGWKVGYDKLDMVETKPLQNAGHELSQYPQK